MKESAKVVNLEHERLKRRLAYFVEKVLGHKLEAWQRQRLGRLSALPKQLRQVETIDTPQVGRDLTPTPPI